MATNTLTELEAVNLILASADMMPVTQLTPTTTAEATLAKQQLDSCKQEILNEGWFWNTEYEFELAADDTGVVYIDSVNARTGPDYTTSPGPPDYVIMRFDCNDSPSYIVRGDRLYDREDKSDNQFSRSVKGTAVFDLDWEKLPFEAINYIAKKAARRFHEYHVGSSDALRSLIQDEQEGRRLLLDMELDVGHYSMFDSPDLSMGLSRGNYLAGHAMFGRNRNLFNRDGGI